MCGLIGVISKNVLQDFDTRYVRRTDEALNAMYYRGPDHKGSWHENGICLGHRRLSIIDLSSHGNQPFHHSDNRYILVFNGEIYNYQELKGKLIKQGHVFRTETDTEVIIAAYKEYGERFCEELRGMFVMVLYDKQEDKVVFARDRLGKKPLFIFENDDVIIFSSEIKFFHAYDIPLDIDEASLKNYLSLQYVPAPGTIYKQVRQLQPAEMFSYDRKRGRRSAQVYWDIYSYNGLSASPPSLDEIDELLTTSVKYRLVANVDVGLLLSGGIDSSLLAAYMTELAGSKVRAFNVGFADTSLDESPFAKKVADALQLDLVTLNLEDISADNFIDSVYHADQPFGDSAMIPTYLIAKSISEHVKVVLSGEGADELFHGYDHYNYERHYYRLGEFLFRGAGALMEMLPTKNHAFERLKAKLRSINTFKKDTGSSRWTSILSPQLAGKYLQPQVETDQSYEDLFNSYLLNFRKNAGSLESSLMLDLLTWLPDDLLVKTDRMMMACSVEARTPFLDHQLVERILMSSGDFKANLFQSKNYLRVLLQKKLPASVSNFIARRPKHGFETPKRKWMKGSLSELSSFLFSEDNLQRNPHLNSSAVSKLWEDFKRETPATNARLTWNLFCFLEWYRQHESKFGFRK